MSDIEKKGIKGYSSSQENALVQASYKMSLNEKRLLVLGMSKLNPRELKKIESSNTPEIVVTADEWLEVFPDDLKPYRSISQAGTSLLSRQWVRHGVDRRRRGNWFSICDYDDKLGEIRLKFTHESSFWLYDFNDRFISTRVAEIGKLTSFNQIRMHELFMQFSPACGGSGFMSVEVEDLRRALQLEDSYPVWTDFKRRVLVPCMKAINQETDMIVELTKTVKRKRNVHSLQFHIGEERQGELDL